MCARLKGFLLVVLALSIGLGCLPVFASAEAEIQPKAIYSVDFYDLTDPNGTYYKLSEGSYSWKAITGHKYQLKVSASGQVSYKSNKPSVASVSSNGIVTAKKDGQVRITITDKSSRETRVAYLRVLKNQHIYRDYMDWDDEVWGVFSIANKVYVKGSYLYVDMYIINASDRTIGNLGPQSVYLATPWNDNYSEKDYSYVCTWSGKMSSLKPMRSRVVTIKIGRCDPAAIYLRNADAYCKGGIVRGHLWWHSDY